MCSVTGRQQAWEGRPAREGGQRSDGPAQRERGGRERCGRDIGWERKVRRGGAQLAAKVCVCFLFLFCGCVVFFLWVSRPWATQPFHEKEKRQSHRK